MLFGHGSDGYKYKNIVADFSSNVWYQGLPDGLAEHLSSKFNDLVNYPEPDAGKLAKALSKLHMLNPENVLVCNGASEAFYLVAQLYTGFKSGIVIPAFAEYEDACKVFKHIISIQSYDEFRENNFSELDLIWLGNPNNPDGKLWSLEFLESKLKANPNTVFILDEAYGELCVDFESVISLVNSFPNLIVVKSLTKAFAIPGLRLGYILTSKTIIEKLKSIKVPWSVNSLAIEAGLYITKNYNKQLPNKTMLLLETENFQKQLSQINGIELSLSKTNYCLCKLKNGTSSELKNYLIKKHGILIRDASNFQGLNKQHFRVALQAPDKNHLLLKGLNDYLNNE